MIASRSPPMYGSQHPNVYTFETDESGIPQTLTLPCPIVDPSPTVNYTWFREDQELPGSMVNEEGSLIVPNITEGEYASREGVDYYCIAWDNIGFDVAVRSRNITVYFAYFDDFERMPRLGETTVEVPVPVALNSDVALKCDVVAANPPPQISWYDDRGEIQEVHEGNNVRFLDDGCYLYIRGLQTTHLGQQYYCAVTNVNLSQEVSAPTRYVLTDTLIQGELKDYKQIGDLRAFVGNTSFEFAFIGGAYGNNSVNGTRNDLFVNNRLVATLGNIGQVNNITSTFLSSSGIIQLKAAVHYNSLSSTVLRTGSLTVHQVPRITNTVQYKREYLVGEGSLMYVCEFEGSPLPDITFYFNGAAISPGSGVTIVDNTLTIPSPQVFHSGIYQCIVSNEFGDDQAAWLLEIRQPISPKVQPLNFTELGAVDDRNVGVLIVRNSGSTIRFSVDVAADPCPDIVWKFNSTALGPSNNTFNYNNPCIESGDGSFVWTYKLNVILSLATSGLYAATFTNFAGSALLPMTYFTVPRPVSIVSLNLSEACLKKDSNVSLRCYTHGYPRPNIQFLLDNTPITPGVGAFENFVQENFDQLVITYVTLRAGGHYTCSVLGGQQQITRQFEYCTEPRITGVDSTRDPQIGQPFYVECMFTGIPAPHVIWRKDKELINTTNGRYEITTVPASFSRLETSADSKPNDEFNGLYECIITNDAGSDNMTFDMELKAVPSLSREAELGIGIGIGIGVPILCFLVFLMVIVIVYFKRREDEVREEGRDEGFQMAETFAILPGIERDVNEWRTRGGSNSESRNSYSKEDDITEKQSQC